MSHAHRTPGGSSAVPCALCPTLGPRARDDERRSTWAELQGQAEELAARAGFRLVALSHAERLAWLCPGCVASLARELSGAREGAA